MVRPRGHAQYVEPWGRRGGRRRRPWLRTAQLNLAGWSALLGACLLAAAAGVAVTAAAHGPLLLGAARPVHIMTPSATVRRIVNVTAITTVDAMGKTPDSKSA